MGAIILVLAACLGSAMADEASIARGQAIWKDKAGCAGCHGWAGDGSGGLHHEGHALSLRATELTRDQIRMTIQCGRPGTPMPHFDRFAYTDKRCYDMTEADLGDKAPPRASTTLQPYEIDDLADYVAAKLKGAGPVTRAECLSYYQAASSGTCDRYPDK
ncbi:MAG TPA: c-type cytochrome [Rhodopila sp.]|nr:c-type cytochrome [Rhodopila sp.]